MPVVFLFIISKIHAQPKHTISGYIRDAQTGEQLIGATVRAEGALSFSTASNEYGFFSLTAPAGTYKLLAGSVGYRIKSSNLNLNKNIPLSIKLTAEDTHLSEVLISATGKDEHVKSAKMGVERLSMKEIEKVPVIFGERDLIKVIQLLPGVKSAGEGSSGFFVRGGGADQNLVLLDEAVVYNPSHLLGFFSTFNSDAIKDVTLYKGNIPAQYGGRLSSVMDVKMNDGNNQKISVNGGIGIIASRITVEGPIVKNKGSFLLSARRTYADLLLKVSSDSVAKQSALYFYDVNLKANYQLTAYDRIYLSGYLGQDKLGLGGLFGLEWGNKTGTLRWNHQFSPKLFANTSVIYSDYRYHIDLYNTDSFEAHINSQIKDWNIKEEFSLYPDTRNTWRMGLNSVYHTIRPGEYSGDLTLVNQPYTFSWENSAYISNEWKASGRLKIEYGLRLSAFSVLGGDNNFYALNAEGAITDTLNYAKGKIVRTYFNLEPRFSAAYQLGAAASLKAAYSRSTQSLHQLSSSATSSPTDKWVATNNIITPEIADQVSFGYFKNLKDNKYEFSAETYYKRMQHQVDYKDGANIRSNDPIEPQLLFGRGRAYGLELLLRKKTGRLTGWIGYTLSRTERQIDGINEGDWYNARQDRTHDISLVGICELDHKWSLSSTFVYATGNAVSFPSGKYYMDDQVVFLYTRRNAYRMPAYHRLDLSATCKLKERKNFSSELTFGVYNAYGRANAYAITFRQNAENQSKTEAVQTSLFKFVPSVTYNFKF
ncbi:TonB-dependent Receptor Plug Domain [Pedobacter hartonius]|uniref:TonB-dependent Receptor Plug Domain n=1 Tax=Pedobacter hartonius TaxID=425514 RepID=A0A1H4AYH2_9SPHI|nr:TonB-dependent Receptor Plug Domain [Pedobacter hartonius]